MYRLHTHKQRKEKNEKFYYSSTRFDQRHSDRPPMSPFFFFSYISFLLLLPPPSDDPNEGTISDYFEVTSDKQNRKMRTLWEAKRLKFNITGPWRCQSIQRVCTTQQPTITIVRAFEAVNHFAKEAKLLLGILRCFYLLLPGLTITNIWLKI